MEWLGRGHISWVTFRVPLSLGYRSYQVGKNCQAEGVGRMERKSVLLLPLQGTCEFLGYLNPVGAGCSPDRPIALSELTQGAGAVVSLESRSSPQILSHFPLPSFLSSPVLFLPTLRWD